MQKILKSYLRRLSNLSGNNRSLLLLRLLKDQFIDIHDFDYAENEASFEIIKKLIEQQKKILLCSEVDSRNKSANELSKRLKKIKRIEKFIFDERGAKDLYIGWPFIKGKFADETLVRCPLLFFPVAIEKSENEWFLSRREDVNITLNKTFLLAYSYYNQIPLDEELIETVIDDYDRDDTVFRTQLYELLKNTGVEINFNQENFSDELKAFNELKKSQLESSEKTGALKMYPNAVLGIFPQSGSYLVPDYVKLLEDQQETDLEEFFVKKVQKENENQLALFDRVNEENTFTPFPLDAYQEHALKEIKKGNSLVVQGPPGTGKSQLISNLICDFIARGKNVLLVCQKKAALDVVYQRLKEKEMHDFVALVHDFKNDRKPIYEQIDQQIESVEVYEKKNNSLDAIQLERGFLQASRRIDQIVEELQEFREALFDESECGKSVKELYLSSSPDEKSFSMNLEYRAFHFSSLSETERKFKAYLGYFDKFEKRTHFWAKGPSFATFQTKDLVQLKNVLYEVPEFNQKLIDTSKSFCSQPVDFETGEYLSTKLPELIELFEGLKEAVVFKVYQQLHGEKPTKDLNWLSQTERTMMACFRGVGVESTLESSNLGRFQEVLQSAMRARKNPFSWLKWKLFSKEKTFLKRVMVANDLKSNKRGFNVLVERIDNRLNFEHSLSQIQDNPWLHNFPESFRKIDLQDWFYWQKMGLNMYTVAQTVRSLNEYIPVKKVDHKAYHKRLDQLISLVHKVPQQLTLWKRYINVHQIRAIILKKEDPHRLEKLLKKDFDAICEYHKLKTNLSSEETKVLDEMTEQNGSIDEAITLFKNSLSLAWIDHIESKYPDLRNVASGKLDALAEELREQIEAKRQASKEILLLKSREKTYENIEYNRLKNRITYRDLQHQVTKKRRIWPIRKVIAEFAEELFTLLPCWMCSPESASAIFPMQESFDLVIFDEASQCFAERGIPAMYRGRQIVVSGDSMQLQPSDLYRVRWDDADDDTPELAIDSLLDLTKHYLPEVSLAGHYRSKSLELIDFSNEHFYKGKLRLLPDYAYVNKHEAAIEYVQSKGVWDDGINEIEAGEVVAQTLKILENEPEKEIGIVTFNYRQQGLILDLLEEKSAQKNMLLPDSLFVKNIENVQGDERDIIIFSIGYAPDKKGKLKLQFGSLNAAGGENRLNVAVTRAREKVLVVCSILPQLLRTEDTKNEGPKLLKKYLEYAWNVSTGQWTPHLPKYEEHHVDWFLRNRIQDKSFHEFEGFELAKELPFADLSVKKNKTYTGLILTDDERYYQALSPKQIYAFQHFHLQMKNWPHVRFHSRELWLDPESAKEKMRKFLYSN
ncbi:AAA domain-containing protein [Ekhidna lutea]|uniref:AAA domain-containing protein n=1 Tax=Ekhidna lutea TaxID=447679 RepID=A0A239FP80_EKHLU|nr:AAA domain-containing protein [Ekhidna lutea]SNS57724.1 AAA domain-containing protein [Ekhidna lutea]